MAIHPEKHLPYYPTLWQMLGALLFAIVALGSLAPISLAVPGPSLPHMDKIMHMAAYALLTAWYLAISPGRTARVFVPLMLLAAGLAIEWLQGMTGYRTASLADAWANLAGVIFGATLLVRPFRRVIMAIEYDYIGVPQRPQRRRRSKRLRHQALWQIVGAYLAITVLLTAFVPIELDLSTGNHVDKILHFLTYGTLTAWFLLAFPGRKRGLLIPAVMISLSISLETMQGMTRFGGDPSLFDVLADVVGIGVASMLVFSPLRHLLRRIERRLSPARYRKRHPTWQVTRSGSPGTIRRISAR